MSQALGAHDGFFREHRLVLGVSVAAHAALLLLFIVNLELWPRPAPQPVRLAIQATVVDARSLRTEANTQRLAQLRAAEQEAQREESARQLAAQQRSDDARRQKVHEQETNKQQLDKQKVEQKKEEQQKAQTQVQARRQAETESRQQAEDLRRKADAERHQAQTRADLARQMAEEERLNVAAQAGLLDRYADVIRQKVERNWIRPAGVRPGLRCIVNVKQIPGGEVVDVRIGECNGDAAVIRSIEAAVLRSSPLPAPPDAALFDRSLRFEFKPQE